MTTCRGPGCSKSPPRGSLYCEQCEQQAEAFSISSDPQEERSENEEEPNPQVDPRKCERIKDDGSRCQGWKVKGESQCAGHLGRGLAADPEAYARQGAARSAEVRVERAEVRKRRPLDVVRDGLEADAERFYAVRRKIALDETAPAGDRLRAIEQIESRALGKPKESVSVETEESEAERALRALSPEERLELWKARGYGGPRAVDEQA